MKKLKLLSIFLAFIFLLSSCSEEDPVQTPTTGTIQGKVTNITGDTVIVNANVSTNPPTSSVTTNSSGDYSIPDVSPGQYSVTATKSGYNPTTVTITASAGKITTANIPLNINTTQQGLVAYYPFNGNANDESGNGNNGTVNGAMLTTDRFGYVGKAYSFDGVNDLIDCGNTTSFNSLITNEISISTWIRFNNLSNGQAIVGKWGSYGIVSYLLCKDASNHLLINLNNNVNNIATSSIIPKINIWYYITATANTTGVKLYLNGVLSATSIDGISNINIGTHPVRIGFEDSGNSYFNGYLDDIRIYNRALTDSEIQALYHEGGWQ